MIDFEGLRPYVIDTNSAIRHPSLFKKYQIVVTSHVLRELEKLEREKSNNHELMKKIRDAKRAIDENEDTILIDLKDYVWDINDYYDTNYEDNKILKACVENDYGIITEDRLLRFKADMYNIHLIKPENELLEEGYKGYRVVYTHDKRLAEYYQDQEQNVFDLYVNEYLIIRDEGGKTIDIKRWDGQSHVRLKSPPDKYITHKNDLQQCAIDLLYNTDIPVKFILGTYGSGKTLLSTRMGTYHVIEKGNYAKMMMIRNPIGTGESVGWLKGDFKEKTDGFFKPIIQHLDGGEQEAKYLEDRGQLSAEIPYFMKGLDVQETYMLCDEAEDLDVKLIKLVGTRIGKNSCLVFSGDYNQAEDKFIKDNGLMYAVEGLKDNPLVGVVVLDLDVRSDASKIFADL